jgi:hypothetical protein
MSVTKGDLQTRIFFRADNPFFYIAAMLLLHQDEVIFVKEKNSFAQQEDLKSSSFEDVEKHVHEGGFDGGDIAKKKLEAEE